jgi:CPA2 family monovalent cation:H+ antiporter-2
VVICGYGRVARELVDALEKRGLRYVVVEYNPSIVRELRDRRVPVVYGDAANPVVLEHANVAQAALLAVLIPDVTTVERAVRYAREIKNPSLHVVARVAQASDVERLHRAGASAIVQPEFEAGVEVIRLVLRRYGISDRELGHLVAGRRAAVYGLSLES